MIVSPNNSSESYNHPELDSYDSVVDTQGTVLSPRHPPRSPGNNNTSDYSHVRHPNLHQVFGSCHILLALTVFGVEISELVVNMAASDDQSTPSEINFIGVFSGFILGVTGVIQLISGLRRRHRSALCFINVILILDIISAIVLLLTALNLLLVEPTNSGNGNSFYQVIKVCIIMVVCSTGFTTVVVHAGFACSEIYSRKKPRQRTHRNLVSSTNFYNRIDIRPGTSVTSSAPRSRQVSFSSSTHRGRSGAHAQRSISTGASVVNSPSYREPPPTYEEATATACLP